jgi:hypothetical protein
MRASEIGRAANIYLEANARQLLEEAWRMCQRSSELMKLYAKEQRERQWKTVHILYRYAISPS